MSTPVTCMCTYQLKEGAEDDFSKLLETHWPTLHNLELVTDDEPLIYKGKNSDGSVFFTEIFTWQDEAGPSSAHELAEVMAVWEPMGKLCEDRNGKPAMDFPTVERVS